jgi:hypothetical protein
MTTKRTFIIREAPATLTAEAKRVETGRTDGAKLDVLLAQYARLHDPKLGAFLKSIEKHDLTIHPTVKDRWLSHSHRERIVRLQVIK